MNRTTSSPVGATATLVLVMIGVPLWFITRLAGGALPLRSADVLLTFALAAWIILAKAVVDRDVALDSTAIGRNSPTWHAHRLVDNSMLGVGFLGSPATVTEADGLLSITQPGAISDEQLPTRLPEAESARGPVRFDEAGSRPVPTLRSNEPAAPSALETREYTVARGDTFWSLSEVVLGDGREWQQLQALNVGREVAPQVVLYENQELRIGWSILLPVMADDAADRNDHVV